MRKLGAQLRALREAQGLSYDDVASATHVRPHVIKSIENGTIEETAAPVYARGFMKTYCEYLMASDLWRKYSMGVPSSEEPGELDVEEPEEQIEIKHPTPIFRRSSIIWVYIIIVIAVLGAAYLLWSQPRQPGGVEGTFPLNAPYVSQDLPAQPVSGDESAAAPVSDDVPSVPSADVLPIPEPRSPDAAASNDARQVASGDLSWMDETSASARPLAEIPNLVDRALLIEITGSNNRLTVEQAGKVVTRRMLGIGGRRSYDVTADTKVTVSAGNRTRVTWFGKRYDSVGSDNSAITLVFHPDGSVTLVSGSSPHFARNAAAGN
jgi:cytoskeletal protein RodZ